MGLIAFWKKILGFETPETDFDTVISWINTQGGISYILDLMEKGGFHQVVASWRNKKNLLYIDGDSVLSIIGAAALRPLADKCGTDILGAANLIAQFLPLITDKMGIEKPHSEKEATRLV